MFGASLAAITPDTDFFYPHEGAQASLNMLLVALRSGEGFLKVVGELGCGKTVLCRQLLKTLQGECVTAYIPNPDMGPDDLLLSLADELGVPIQHPVQRHRQFDGAEVGREVATSLGDGVEQKTAQLVGDLPNLVYLEPAQIVRSSDGVEKRRLGKIGQSDIPILHVG